MRFVIPLVVRLAWAAAAFCVQVDAWSAAVAISPATDSVPIGGSRTFTAAVIGLANNAVTWSVSGAPGSNVSPGTISAGGVYTAPAAIPALNTVVVTATAQADPAVSGSALVTVRLPRPLISSIAPNPVPLGDYSLTVKATRLYLPLQALINNKPAPAAINPDGTVTVTGSAAAADQGAASLVLVNPGNVSSAAYKFCFGQCSTASNPSCPTASYVAGTAADPQDVKAARFLEQAAFGPTPAAMSEVKQLGIDAWLDKQLDPALTPESLIPNGLNASQVVALWFGNMAAAPDQLRQRIAFALSQIFVVSSNKNSYGDELIPWVNLLVHNAFGNYKSLMRQVTVSPTMGKFLDLANSEKPSPGNPSGANENYARELLQLFSVGLVQLNQDGSAKTDAYGKPLSSYDQTTIQQLALALTGWAYPTQPGATPRAKNPEYFVGDMETRDASHAMGAKTLFANTPGAFGLPAGQSTAAELDLAIDGIFHHPNVAPFVATRLIRSLVSSNPSAAYVQRVADVFATTGGDLKAVVRAILTDADARQDVPSANQGHLKDPVLHMLSFTRAVGANLLDPGLFQWELLLNGQAVLAPPSVFSYYSPLNRLPDSSGLSGPEYQIYSPSQAILRANLFWELISGSAKTAYAFDLTPYVTAASDPSKLADLINTTLFQGRMSPELRQTLYDTALPYCDLTQRARTVLYLAVLSSEYAVHR
ncbi:MAG: DUF1800 domain-containing protein [Methylococcus sp.]|nr:DUF1800 domain-containing protein [Methylococcus sp.]